MENAYCERFNGKLRDECLNANWFARLTDSQRAIDQWLRQYNDERPTRAWAVEPRRSLPEH